MRSSILPAAGWLLFFTLFAGIGSMSPASEGLGPIRQLLEDGRFEEAVAALEAEARAWRDDAKGYVASGMRLWKRGAVQRFYGSGKGVRFRDDPGEASALAERLDRPLLVWSGKATADHVAADRREVEDGFLRSRGLGAELVPPLSLAADRDAIDAENVSDDVAWLYRDAARHNGTGVVSSRTLKEAEADKGGNPPHRQALDFYRRRVRDVAGELWLTMEFPNSDAPKPIVIDIDARGHTVRKLIASGISTIISSSPPRAGGQS